jgi:hypothetical protein
VERGRLRFGRVAIDSKWHWWEAHQIADQIADSLWRGGSMRYMKASGSAADEEVGTDVSSCFLACVCSPNFWKIEFDITCDLRLVTTHKECYGDSNTRWAFVCQAWTQAMRQCQSSRCQLEVFNLYPSHASLLQTNQLSAALQRSMSLGLHQFSSFERQNSSRKRRRLFPGDGRTRAISPGAQPSRTQ